MNITKSFQASLKPIHVLAGLGAADRQLLAMSLSLFDDSSFTSQMGRMYQTSLSRLRKVADMDLDAAALDVQSQYKHWMSPDSGSDDELRCILWIRIRESFELPPRLAGTVAGSERLADDLAAAMVHLLSPPPGALGTALKPLREHLRANEHIGQYSWAERLLSDSQPAISLNDVVQPVLEELLVRVLEESEDESVKQQILDEVVEAMGSMSAEDQSAMRENLKVDELNSAAAKKMLLSAGGLAALSGSVSMAGFSAYILAAQASAFIPLVSGPGLVSFLSVVSNPVTAIGGTIAAAWWFSDSASKKVSVSIATRIVAMLAIQGVQAGEMGVSSLLKSFYKLRNMPKPSAIDQATYNDYKQECVLIADVLSKHDSPSDPGFVKAMARPVIDKQAEAGGTTSEELKNAAILTGLTAGEMLYAYFSIDPVVVKAADFAYVADVDGPIALSELAAGFSEGARVRLKGYVAEQIVAMNLAAQGHVVEFPLSASEPGWDLLVDGEKVQVKFREGIDGIVEHFERYDYKVIANTELMGEIPDEYLDRVLFIDGVSNELVTVIVERGIDAGGTLSDPNMPVMALMVSLYRGGKAVLDDQITPLQATEQVIFDGTVRVGLVGVGQVAGTTLGTLVFGPAGAWVFGPGLPILLQTQSARLADRAREHLLGGYEAWCNQAHQAIDEFHYGLIAICRQKQGMMARKHLDTDDSGAGQYLRWKLKDELQFTKELELRLSRSVSRRFYPSPEKRFQETLRWVAASAIHPVCYQDQLGALKEALEKRPTLVAQIRQNEYVKRAKRANSSLMRDIKRWRK